MALAARSNLRFSAFEEQFLTNDLIGNPLLFFQDR